MAKNESLSRAKNAKKDEFYTQYEDIQSELNHYEKHFQGKTVLCNCDDPFESNFCKFFLRNFNYLGLKRLICTSYAASPVIGQQLSLLDQDGNPVVQGCGYVMDISEVPMSNGRGVSDADIDALLQSKKSGVKKLQGDGDFRSEECIEYLKQADIVVTNPPFSLFREYVAQLMEYGKNFLIIGNKNAITYKEIFPLIKDNLMWVGYRGFSGGMWFHSNYEGRTEKIVNGEKLINVPSIWFTNLDHNKRHEKLVLYKRYYGNEEEYPRYANYDAINVDKVADIPCDYFEDIGVPITYLDKHNPEQFDIVGSSRNLGQSMSEIAPEGSYEKGGPRFYLALDKINQTGDTLSRAEQSRAEQSRAEQSRVIVACTTELSSDARCNGVMGVPITFLDKYSPDQFEIIGATESEGKGFSNGLWNSESGVAQPVVQGQRRYKRLFIKRKM